MPAAPSSSSPSRSLQSSSARLLTRWTYCRQLRPLYTKSLSVQNSRDCPQLKLSCATFDIPCNSTEVSVYTQCGGGHRMRWVSPLEFLFDIRTTSQPADQTQLYLEKAVNLQESIIIHDTSVSTEIRTLVACLQRFLLILIGNIGIFTDQTINKFSKYNTKYPLRAATVGTTLPPWPRRSTSGCSSRRARATPPPASTAASPALPRDGNKQICFHDHSVINTNHCIYQIKTLNMNIKHQ